MYLWPFLLESVGNQYLNKYRFLGRNLEGENVVDWQNEWAQFWGRLRGVGLAFEDSTVRMSEGKKIGGQEMALPSSGSWNFASQEKKF